MKPTLLLLLLFLISACLPLIAEEAKPDAPKTEQPPMCIMPAPKAVTIDGDLKEWDLSGKIGPVTFDEDSMDDYHGTFYAMYDKDNLYLAAVIVQPHPPYNTYPYKGVGSWNGDDVIIRMSSNPKLPVPIQGSEQSMAKSPDLFTADFWWNHQKKLAYWDGYYGMDGDHLTTDKMPGIEVAVKSAKDGKGYTSEIKVPWKLINPNFHPQAGDQIAFTWEISVANNNPSDPARAFQIFANGGGSWAFTNPGMWGKAVFK